MAGAVLKTSSLTFLYLFDFTMLKNGKSYSQSVISVKANLEFAREGKFLSESKTLLSLTLINLQQLENKD